MIDKTYVQSREAQGNTKWGVEMRVSRNNSEEPSKEQEGLWQCKEGCRKRVQRNCTTIGAEDHWRECPPGLGNAEKSRRVKGTLRAPLLMSWVSSMSTPTYGAGVSHFSGSGPKSRIQHPTITEVNSIQLPLKSMGKSSHG